MPSEHPVSLRRHFAGKPVMSSRSSGQRLCIIANVEVRPSFHTFNGGSFIKLLLAQMASLNSKVLVGLFAENMTNEYRNP